MGNLSFNGFTYKLTLACAWLVCLICHFDLALSVEIECIPLNSCPTVLKLLKSTKKYAPEAIEFLKSSHCGFVGKGQPKVWCGQLNFCKTPDNRNGTCTSMQKCGPFLQLRATVDTSDLDAETFLNQFRCNTILKEAHVCCPDDNLPIRPNPFITPRIPDIEDRFDYSDYDWQGDEPQYYNQHDRGVRDAFWGDYHLPGARNNHGHWHIGGNEEAWGIPKHHGFHGFRHQNTPKFAYGRDNPDYGFNNRDIPKHEARDLSNHNEGNSHGSSEDDSWNPSDTIQSSGWKPNKQATPRNRHDTTTRKYHSTRRDWEREEQTTLSSRNGNHGSSEEDSSSWKPQKPTTPRSRHSTTTRKYRSDRRDCTEAPTTPSGESSTDKYDSDSTTRRSDWQFQQQTTPGNSDGGIIIFEDSSETGNSGGASEQTTNRVNDARSAQNTSCETPDRKTGVCTEQGQCQPYLKLQDNLDKSKKTVSDYLNKFRCNSATTSEIYVCCQNEEEDDIDNTVISAERTNENVPRPYEEICGRQTASTNKIFGGANAALGEFPWMALLQYRGEKGMVSGCGGALINSRYVLTAAHCVDEEILKTRKLQPLSQVILGEYDTRNETDCIYMKYGTDCADPIVMYGVDSIVSHSLYNSDTTRNDIALVRLNREVPYTDFIIPICLPAKTLTLNGNESFVLAGWGRTPTEMSSPILKKVKIPFAQKQSCNTLNLKRRTLIDGQFCVGRGNGTDSCSGDSGGPIMLEVNLNFEFVTYVIGIVSYGIADCGDGPSVNTYVPNYIDWINDNVK